jgi:AAA+ superfamily predicted ATPase
MHQPALPAQEKKLPVADIYQDHLEHLKASLARLDALLALGLKQFHRRHQNLETGENRGLFISEAEVAALLRQAPRGGEPKEFPREQALAQHLEVLAREMDEKTSASLAQGRMLTLPLLASIFDLSPWEADALLICLAPELDEKYEKIYAYLQDNLRKSYPTGRLVLDLLCGSFAEEAAARTRLSPQAPLLRYRLLEPVEASGTGSISPLSRALRVDDRVVRFILGDAEPDARVQPFATLVQPEVPDGLATLDRGVSGRLLARAHEYLEKKFPAHAKLVFNLAGPCPATRLAAALAVSRGLGLPLLRLDLEALVREPMTPETALLLAFREGLLQPAIMYVEAGAWAGPGPGGSPPVRVVLFKSIEELSWLTILASSEPGAPPPEFIRRHIFIRQDLTDQAHPRPWELLQAMAGNGHAAIPADELASLSNKFRFTAAQVQEAWDTARNLAIARDGVAYRITSPDLHQAARLISNQNLGQFGRKIRPRFTWDDLILPEDRKNQLREISQYVKYQHLVFSQWGFQRKLSAGRGLNILFAGLSGTGKTMAAEILADELGMDLYKIDLSMVVSKYIGETEKNLARIFLEAATSNAILFFDEADALFGKRSEVKDAHDRYANIEINYLLQKLEDHEGIVILASNFQKNMDDAFVRRLHFTVELPFPDREHRLRLWQAMFPPEAPLAPDLDWPFLAKQFKLSGGHIKNIAIQAAFLAAADSGSIGMHHLILATKREFQKLGKMCVRSDFQQYFDLIKDQEAQA